MGNTYFSYAYPQHYVANTTSGFTTSGGTISLLASGNMGNLTRGQIGFFATDQYGQWSTVATSGSTGNVTLGYGSIHLKNNIVPNYQGLMAPFVSKTISWRNVTLFQYKKGHVLQNQIVSIGWDQTTSGATSAVGPLFYCGTNYTLKLEYLGDAVLAALNKEGYSNLQAWGGCCNSTCTSGCTGTAVDAAYIMLQWKDRVNQNPLLTPFLTPQVFISSGGVKTEVFDAYDNSLNSSLPVYIPNTANPASVVASFQVSVTYVGTTFGDATFSQFDRYEYTPIWLLASLMMEDGNPCAFTTTINTSVPNMFTDVTTAITGNPMGAMINSGEAIARSFMLSNSYRQQKFLDSMNVDILRMREILDSQELNVVSRSGIYDQVILVFNAVGNSNTNPTGAHDRDNYQIVIDVLHGTDVTPLTNYITSCLTAVGSNVTLSTIN